MNAIADQNTGLAAPPGHATHFLNEGEAAALLGISRRTFHAVRQRPWFVEVCVARELGPRALRWPRDELLLAAKNAPKRIVLAEPPVLAAARERKTKATA